jgi:hypothetical protein
VPVAEATHALIAPLLLLALHRHSIGAALRPELDAPTLIDAQIDLMLHGLQRRAPRPARKAAA